MSTNEIFISYSRRDIEFVELLVSKLYQQEVDPWYDKDDIPKGEEWWAQIVIGIEQSNSFLVVLSPDYMRSQVCQWELAKARMYMKKIIPVMVRDVFTDHDLLNELNDLTFVNPDGETIYCEANWKMLTKHNYVIADSFTEFDDLVGEIIAISRIDYYYLKTHTQILGRAIIWLENQKDNGFLLTQRETKDALDWLQYSSPGNPPPSLLHIEFIEKSNRFNSTIGNNLLRFVRQTTTRFLKKNPRKVFISYRRTDTAQACGRIYDRLAPEFGEKNVFLDVDTIDFGVDFSEFIQQYLVECFAVLVIIGSDWTRIIKERYDQDVTDYVRIEIETALRYQHINVIPLFVDGAQLPASNDLPPDIRSLTMMNGAKIRAGRDFHRDMDVLLKELKQLRKNVNSVD